MKSELYNGNHHERLYDMKSAIKVGDMVRCITSTMYVNGFSKFWHYKVTRIHDFGDGRGERIMVKSCVGTEHDFYEPRFEVIEEPNTYSSNETHQKEN